MARQMKTPKSWTNQFLKSLDNYQETDLDDMFLKDLKNWCVTDFDPNHPSEDMLYYYSMEEWLQSRLPPATDNANLQLITFRALVSDLMSRAFYAIDKAQKKCKSPIETQMLAALTIVGMHYDLPVLYIVDGFPCRVNYHLGDDLTIEPQAKLGKYRVDFLLTYLERGSEGVELARTQMVVECDGHNYHSRTKEQARKDRERDRIIQSLGLRVFRYTGSEIWEDVFKCACEAINTLIKETRNKPAVLEKYKYSWANLSEDDADLPI